MDDFRPRSWVFLLVLAACGCSSNPPLPVAVIGAVDLARDPLPLSGLLDGGVACEGFADPNVDGQVGMPALITAECSYDERGRSLTYEWTLLDQPSGSLAELSGTERQRPTLIPDLPGRYRLQLVVSNGRDESLPAEIFLNVDMCGSNAPTTTASAVPPATITGGAVQLQAVGTDADNSVECGEYGQVLTYAWHFIEVPAGSATVIFDATGARPGFVADVPGDYVAEVVVTDDTGRSTREQVTVTADVCGSNAPVAAVDILGPGGMQACGSTINLGGNSEVLLGGGSSMDADNTGACSLNQNLFYQWELLSTPLQDRGTRLRNPTGVDTVLDVNFGDGTTSGRLDVRLIVTDETGRVSRDVVCSINVTNVG